MRRPLAALIGAIVAAPLVVIAIGVPAQARSNPVAMTTIASESVAAGRLQQADLAAAAKPVKGGLRQIQLREKGTYHGYWAIDFEEVINQAGSPVYAAGAGRVHVRSRGTTCTGTNPVANAMQIDHGGGVTSVYFHLRDIAVAEGAWVDENTIIGHVGSTGHTIPCPDNHLHYELRVNDTPVYPGSLKACHGGMLVTYPQDLGYSDWNAIPAQAYAGGGFKPNGKSVWSHGTSCGNARIPVPGDYDGNGTSDQATFERATGIWRIGTTSIQYGMLGDVPMPADYNGDGRTDLGLFRPSNSSWYVRGRFDGLRYGEAGDIPATGDFNGDGLADTAVFRSLTGRWYVRGQLSALPYGSAGDIPVLGDYDADGRTDFAVYRPSTYTWYVRNLIQAFKYGAEGDVPLVTDFNHNGRADLAVYRPRSRTWYARYLFSAIQWGVPGDVPVVADFNGNGRTDIAVYRPAMNSWPVRPGS